MPETSPDTPTPDQTQPDAPLTPPMPESTEVPAPPVQTSDVHTVKPTNKKLVLVLVVVSLFVLLAAGGVLAYRYFYPTATNVATTNPSASPAADATWQTYQVPLLGLTYQAPSNLTVNLEEPNPGVVTLYIENGVTNFECTDDTTPCYYQLYLIAQTEYFVSEEQLGNLKSELIPDSIVETTVGGYPAIQGQVAGERNRYVTYIIKDNVQISIWTAQPTTANKLLTDQILATFEFSTNEASLKTYAGNGLTFFYPTDWTQVGSVITSPDGKLTMTVASGGVGLMNECMALDSTQQTGEFIIKKYSRVSTGEFCATQDTTPRQIWVIADEESFYPGFTFSYSSVDSELAEKTFDQILSTTKLVN